MRASRKRRSSSALAGWLFADLALILSFVFLNSDVTGTSANSKASVPSSTTIDMERAKGGADPVPTVVTVAFTGKTSRAQLISRVESALAVKEVGAQKGKPFLVAIIYGGASGGPASQGDIAAERAKKMMSGYWSRLVKGVTYFVLGHDGSSPAGTLVFKLFPVSNVNIE